MLTRNKEEISIITRVLSGHNCLRNHIFYAGLTYNNTPKTAHTVYQKKNGMKTTTQLKRPTIYSVTALLLAKNGTIYMLPM